MRIQGTLHVIDFALFLWPRLFSPEPSGKYFLKVTHELAAAEPFAGPLV
jgi:hypothetical protein